MIRTSRAFSLSTRLTITYTFLIVLVAGTLTLSLYLQLRKAQREAIRERLDNIVSLAAPQIDGDFHSLIVSAADTESSYYHIIQDSLRKIQATSASIKHMYTLRRQQDGSLVFVVDLAHAASPQPAFAPGERLSVEQTSPLLLSLAGTLNETVVEDQLQRNAGGEIILHGYGPIYDQSGRLDGVLVIELDASDVIASETQARDVALTTFFITLPLVLLLGFWIVGRLMAPVKELVRGADCIGQGHLDERVQVRGKDELGILATTFNAMADSLQARIAAEQYAKQELVRSNQKLEEYSETLELKVEQRTAELARAMQESQDARTAAEEANLAKSQFLANMSHELRTPLNAIIGYSEMLQEEAIDLDYADSIPDLKKIHTAGKHLLELINDILDLSKIEAGKMSLYLETIDIALLLDSVVTTIQPMIEKKNNSLHVQTNSTLSTLYADQTKVRQILFNLLSNASKFTEQGQISLKVESVSVQAHQSPDMAEHMLPPGEWLVFEINDTGIGMNAEQMVGLFQAFMQADPSTTRKYGGTGLGLAISKRFCRMMGGDIAVKSVVGEGTTFTVHLPTVVKPQLQEKIAGEEDHWKKKHEQRTTADQPASATVLVIDDDPVVRELIARWLFRDGLCIETASSGSEGLAQAKALHPDAIILDVMMPGMDGWSVLTAIKSDPTIADIPVIMMTIVDEKEMGFSLGATDYLTKPINPHRLLSIVRNYQQKSCTDDEAEAENRHILVVEDDEVTREMLRRILVKDGWNVKEAANGRLALDSIAEKHPDLILLDLMMPEMGGFQVISKLRTTPGWQAIPVIVVTAMELTEDEKAFLNGSVAQILQKAAYSRDELLREVHQQVLECLGERV